MRDEKEKVPGSNCPYCDHYLDAAFDPKNTYTPTPGAISVCAYCVEVSEFDENMKLQKFDVDLIKDEENMRQFKLFQQVVRRRLIEKKNIPVLQCPGCKEKVNMPLEGSIELTPEQIAQKNHIGVCLHCAQIFKLNKEIQLEAAIWDEVPNEVKPLIKKMQEVAHDFQKQRKNVN